MPGGAAYELMRKPAAKKQDVDAGFRRHDG
jgi:hypothetical protein